LLNYNFQDIYFREYIAFLCIPANFFFVAVHTRTMKVKNKHISVGLSNYRTARPVGCRNIRLSG